MTADPKHVVARGYDAMHHQYVGWGGGHTGRRHSAIDWLFEQGLVDERERALDLGCGTGELGTAYLRDKGLEVAGVDISPASVASARTLFPDIPFLCGDMATLEFKEESFALVTAFYSIFHVPRAEHAQLFERIAGWLRPGGVFVATLGVTGWEGSASDWLGVPMFWSHFDAATAVGLVEAAGLDVINEEIDTGVEHGVEVSFLALVAQKPTVSGVEC